MPDPDRRYIIVTCGGLICEICTDEIIFISKEPNSDTDNDEVEVSIDDYPEGTGNDGCSPPDPERFAWEMRMEEGEVLRWYRMDSSGK